MVDVDAKAVDYPSRDSDFNFFVQVAASRSPLSPEELASRYSGAATPEIREEEGWYKYQIGKRDNYIEAFLTLRSVGVKDAFMVVYDQKGKKMKLWRAILKQRDEIPDFFVQIAASREELSENEIDEIYSGGMIVKKREEENWFKYQIEAGTTLNQALKILKKIDVEGAFPVAYINDKKLNLSEMVPLFRLFK